VHRKSVYFLVVAVAILIVIGCVMLFSTSAFAKDSRGDPNFFITRQCMWLGFGFVICVIASNVDYHFWQRTWWIWFSLSALLLALCFIPPIGQRLNGSARWVKLGITFQPSELAKLASVCALAWWFSRKETDSGGFLSGFVYPIAGTGILLALIAPEVDMGSTALIAATMFTLMFIAGTRLRYIAPVFAAGLAGMIYIATHIGERQGRLLAFLDLEKYKEGAGLQQWQALIAFGSGGVEGLGLGNGRQKMAYLPYAHTDFIFPMVGEELGLRFTLLIVLCYVVIILCGTLISMQARDRFGMLLGFGVVLLLAFQAAVNIGVTTSLLPNKGLPLPFISYGGSNLVLCLLFVGILINIYRQGVSEKSEKTEVLLRARTRPGRGAMRI
jgi:cell division protein FtsW